MALDVIDGTSAMW